MPMASSSSSSQSRYPSDHAIFVRPIIDSLSTLEQQLLNFKVSHTDDRDLTTRSQFEKLFRELSYIRSTLSNLNSLGNHVADKLSLLENCVRDFLESGPAAGDSIQSELRPLASRLTDLKVLLPSLRNVSSGPILNYRKVQTNNGLSVHNELFEQTVDADCSVLQKEILAGLNDGAKQLLLYFAAFPLGAVVSKRILKNWWLGESEAQSQLPADEAENEVDRLIEELVLRCLIQALRKQRRLIGFRMSHGWVHCTMVRLASLQKFFAFDSKGNPTLELQPLSPRVCWVRTRDGGTPLNSNSSSVGLDKVVTVFNISDPYPYIKPDFFSRAKDIRVLSLGKWEISDDCHIEVESTEFLKSKKSWKNLRLFSLRGVSRVFELPDALCNLSSLTMLDLNACHSLEELPEGIGSLKSLVYLDISECYLLEKMPKGLASLSELRVLKGFLIVDDKYGLSSCNFKDLAGLKKLKKLSINTNRSDFPAEGDLDTFRMFPLLEKLTISWGGQSKLRKPKEQADQAKSMPKPGQSQIKSQQANSSSNPNPELQSLEVIIRSNTEGTASGHLEDRSAEPRISSGCNSLDIKDIQAGTTGDAEPKLKGVRNENSEDVADKETDPRRKEGHVNAGEIVEETESALPEVDIGSTFGRVDSAGNKEPVIEGTRTADEAKQHQAAETTKKPIKKLHTMFKWTKGGAEAAPKLDEIFPRLDKLNLQCYPKGTAPVWLMPRNMTKLRKLYILGGKLRSLDKVQGYRTWKVEILRLKFLEEMETDWRDLQSLFPELIYMEKVQHVTQAKWEGRHDWRQIEEICKITTFKRRGRGARNGKWVEKQREQTFYSS